MFPSMFSTIVKVGDEEVEKIARRVAELILEELLRGLQARDKGGVPSASTPIDS